MQGDQAIKHEQYEYEDDDEDDSSDDARDEPSSGPIRTQHAASSSNGGAGSSKTPIARPVKSACTFCRSRKSRCNGKQPCAACINRGRTDDCVYTISRRGGKVKPKSRQHAEPFETHLEQLLGLSDLPHLVRIPNLIPQLQAFHESGNDFDPFQGIDPSHMLASLTNQQQQQQQQVQGHRNGFPSSITSPSALRMPTLDSNAISAPSPKSLVMDYYTYIYRFVPVLPAPQYIDVIASAVQPGSPLLLSLQCIIPVLRDQPLLPQAQPFASDEDKKAAIRAEAQFYARQAYDVIDEVLERAENQQDKEEAGILEVIQALCILVIYEYGSGRALKSRLKVDAALTLAMSKGLHRLSATRASSVETKMTTMSAGGPHYLAKLPAEEVFEVKKRVWWTLWMHAMWTAYNTGRIPTVRADDSRVTSDLPSCPDGTVNLWSNVVTSLQGLLLVQDRILALTHIEMGRGPTERTTADGASNSASLAGSAGSERAPASGLDIPKTFSGLPTMLSREDVLRSMVDLDTALQQQMRVLEETTTGVIGPTSGTLHSLNPHEDETQRILKFLWAIQVYTTSLTLHIGQAFQGASLFERKLCFLSSISEANDEVACQVPMPNAFDDTVMSNSTTKAPPVALAPTQDLYARGPFLPRDSLKRCVDASDKLLSISRNLRRSEGHMASPNPFNACSFVLISFVCLMQALAISSNAQEEASDGMSGLDNAGDGVTAANQSSSSATSTLLRSAQGAAALTSSQGKSANNGVASDNAAVAQVAALQSPPVTFFGGASAVDGARPSRQSQLQQIWARVKEAKDALQGLSRYWDMVIPMREEVSGCLEASQFLLSQQPQTSAPVEMATLGGGTL